MEPLNLGRKYKLLEVSWVRLSRGMFQDWPSISPFPILLILCVTKNSSQKKKAKWFIQGHTAINGTVKMRTQGPNFHLSGTFTTLHYSILHQTILQYTILHYTTLLCIILHYNKLYHTAQHYNVHHTILYYTTLYSLICIILYYTIAHYTKSQTLCY